MRFIVCVAVLAVLLPLCVVAQVTTGSVQGRVFDPTGAVVPGVEIELVNIDTNIATRASSNETGVYIFNLVPPGNYLLRARYASFKTSETRGIVVEIGRNTVIDVNIQPGDVTQSIEVTAATENIDTQSSVVRTNIASRMILDLPSGSRNPLRFAEMAPGVNVYTGGLTGGSQMLGRDGVSANVSGGRTQQNTFYLDGADNSNVRRNSGLQFPNVEAIQEVQVVTNSNSAEYGKQPGGYFNVITKSGTNDYHGSAYYFFHNNNLNANTWQRNRSGLARQPDSEKQTGGTLGGRILRDRTFFFTSYQHYRDENTTTSSTIRYPTAKMIAGDFSQYTGTLYHPDTNQPIPGKNLAAAGLLDPVAVQVAKELVPTVANIGDRLIYDYSTPPRNNEFLGKVDHNLSPVQRLQFSYFATRGSTGVVAGGTRALPKLTAGSNDVAQNTFAGRHTWTISPSSILESQVSFAQFRFESAADQSVQGRDISDYGAVWPTSIKGGRKYMPDLEVLDSFNSPQVTGGRTQEGNFRLSSTLTRIVGTHNIKFGGEAQRSGFSRFDDTDGSQFRFQGRFSNRGSSQFPSIANAQFVHSFADFMMGRVNDFTAQGMIDYSLPAWGFFGFVQDQWRVTRKLTVNPGLRYEIWKGMREENGRASAFWEGHQSDQFPNAPRNIAFQGDRGIPDGFIAQDRNNFAPRIGASYDVFGNGKLALRAGYGLYYAFPAAQIKLFSTEEFPQRPVVQGFTARLGNPWATSETPKFSAPPTPYPDTLDWIRAANFTPPYARIIGFSPEFTTPLSHQWNLGVEREIRNGFTVNAMYVGNRGRHLLTGYPFNYARYRNLPNGQGPSLDANNILGRVAFPDFNRFSIRVDTTGVIDYDALQLSSNVRMAGVSSRFTYVYAHDYGDGGGTFSTPDEDPEGFTTTTNNPANPAGEYGRRSRTHTFRTFYVYDIPFLKQGSGLLPRIVGGWQLSGTVWFTSGNPIDIVLGYDANFDAITSRPQDRPDLVGAIRYTSGSDDEKMARFFDPSAFGKPAISASNLFGNLPRNALFGPGRSGGDLALLKNFRVRERMNAQVRVEAFNWLNHPDLDAPGTNMSAGDFTRILTKSGNRSMQVGLRFAF